MESDLHRLRELANTRCTCNKEQQTGKNPSTCFSCKAGNALNEIGALIRNKTREIYASIYDDKL